MLQQAQLSLNLKLVVLDFAYRVLADRAPLYGIEFHTIYIILGARANSVNDYPYV